MAASSSVAAAPSTAVFLAAHGADQKSLWFAASPDYYWQKIPSMHSMISHPSIALHEDTIWVVARDESTRAVSCKKTPLGWSAWEEASAKEPLPDTPAIAEIKGTLVMVTRGMDSGVWFRTHARGGAWTAWAEVNKGAKLPSSPFLLNLGTELMLLARGMGNDVYTNSYIGGAWVAWNKLPGDIHIVDTPCAALYHGAVHAFVRGADNKLWTTTRTGETWSPAWHHVTPTSPDLAGSPAAAVIDDALNVIVRVSDGRLMRAVLRASTWSAWEDLPGHGVVASGVSVVTV